METHTTTYRNIVFATVPLLETRPFLSQAIVKQKLILWMVQNFSIARNVGNIMNLTYFSVECQMKSLSNLCVRFIMFPIFLSILKLIH